MKKNCLKEVLGSFFLKPFFLIPEFANKIFVIILCDIISLENFPFSFSQLYIVLFNNIGITSDEGFAVTSWLVHLTLD